MKNLGSNTYIDTYVEYVIFIRKTYVFMIRVIWMKKEKLTLSVDRDVVKKAKSIGLNISEITEMALRGFSFTAEEMDRDAFYKSYKGLFDAMSPILDRYGTAVKIGKIDYIAEQSGELMDTSDIMLFPDGTIYETFGDEKVRPVDITKLRQDCLSSPKEILTDFIDALERTVHSRRDKIKELEVAKRIVEAIASTMQRSPPRRTKGAKNR